MSTDEPLLSIEDAHVHFENNTLMGLGGSETVRAVDGVSLEIPENDVVVLVGESGCGKTTLGKTAVALQRPTGGAVTYRGQDVWEAKKRSESLNPVKRLSNDESQIPWGEIRRSLQIIHQDPGSSMNSNYTVESALEDPLKRWQPNLSKEDRQARIFAMLDRVGMTPSEDYANRYPHQLSGGEQQRVALIRALLMNPDLILADESISALDVSLRVEMMDLMLELQDLFNTSYLFISHNLSNAKYIASKADGRIGIMYLGELVEIGPVEQIIDDPQHPYTKVLKWATPDLLSKNVEQPPLRSLDVPDPSNPPSGCRFHTRCPEARELCKRESPPMEHTSNEHRAACFRTDSISEYWQSEELDDGLSPASELDDTSATNTADSESD
ncbi:ABC transporter ATP-binding protein [Haladaptatus caseinilyticus]|uniref:ABC transporter ATP-binding protein n=1 Tax=Haladaptatus caseinilyticus TaxID=2993314 RepID=UPI00224B219A|nr:ABC transporter ATP-binding protein [Haladaptatus caseinilyticus]